MDDLEFLYQLDHSQAIAQAIFDFALTEPGGILALDGEADTEAILSLLTSHDPTTRLISRSPDGGLIRYQGARIYYGSVCQHPSLRAVNRLCVGQPVTSRRETPYEAPERSKSLLGRLMGR